MKRVVGPGARGWWLAVLLVGCQSASALGNVCARTADCPAPLVCSLGRCRAECAASRDCGIGLRCLASGGIGVCTISSEERCTDAVCAAPLRCVADQCRTECVTDADCRAGVCIGLTCVEPRSGDDAAVSDMGAVDAPPPSDAGVCASSGAGHARVLDVLLGAGHAPAGFRVVASGEVRNVVAPQVAGGFVPPQIALAARATADVPRAWVGYLDDVVGSPRTLHLLEVPLDDLSAPRAFHPLPGTAPIHHVRSFDLATDRDVFHGMATVDPPSVGTDVSAWLFEPGATDITLRAITPMVAVPGQEPGRVAVVGGASPFSTTTSTEELFYAFRETQETPAPATWVLGRIGRDISVSSYRFAPLASPPGYLETAASHGPLLVFADGADVRAWDLREGRTDTVRTLTTGATGAPAIAFAVDDPLDALLVVPSDTMVAAHHVICPAGTMMDCATSGASVTTELGGPVRRVAAATVPGGTIVAAIVEASVDHLIVIALGPDGALVPACDDGTCEALLDIAPASATESLVDVRVAAARGPSGLGVTVAALLRDTPHATDRVWLGGVWSCAQ